jgi:hypothetical protein
MLVDQTVPTRPPCLPHFLFLSGLPGSRSTSAAPTAPSGPLLLRQVLSMTTFTSVFALILLAASRRIGQKPNFSIRPIFDRVLPMWPGGPIPGLRVVDSACIPTAGHCTGRRLPPRIPSKIRAREFGPNRIPSLYRLDFVFESWVVICIRCIQLSGRHRLPGASGGRISRVS